MGYKKLDEIMELLNDELDGFNKSLDKLELLMKNADNIKIKPDTSKIEQMLKEHLNSEKDKSAKVQECVLGMKKQHSKARLIPKTQLWVHYAIWFLSLVIIGYLTFRTYQMGDLQEKAFAKGKQQMILNLEGYFEQNPDHYESYQLWLAQKDRVQNQK